MVPLLIVSTVTVQALIWWTTASVCAKIVTQTI